MKIVASLTAFIFTFTQVVIASPANHLWTERHQSLEVASLPSTVVIPGFDSLQKSISAPAPHLQKFPGFSLPSDFLKHMTVKTAHTGKNKTTVVLFEDVHQNLEAQTHIAEALQAFGRLSGRAPVLVGLEGAYGPFVYDLYKELPYRGVARDVAASFFKSGEISGPAYAGFTAYRERGQRGLDFWGVDDAALYRQNVAAYTQSHRNGLAKKVAALNADLATRKKEIYNPALARFDAAVEEYHAGALPFGDYLTLLARDAQPSLNVELFLQAYGMEKKLDFARVEKERAHVIAALVERAGQAQLQPLVDASLHYQQGSATFADYYDALKRLCAQHGVNLGKTPAFDNYVRYVLLSDGLDAKDLLREMARLEQAAYQRLANTAAEKELTVRSRQLHLTKELIEFTLGPDQWAEYLSGKSALQEPLDLSAYEDFYVAATKRNQALVGNLLARAQSRRARMAVLVSGGFHTSGLEALLREKNVSYLVATPKLTKIDDASENQYLTVFDREKPSLEKLFAGPRLYVPEAVAGAAVPLRDGAANPTRQMAYYNAVLIAARSNQISQAVRERLAALGLRIQDVAVRALTGGVEVSIATDQGALRTLVGDESSTADAALLEKSQESRTVGEVKTATLSKRSFGLPNVPRSSVAASLIGITFAAPVLGLTLTQVLVGGAILAVGVSVAVVLVKLFSYALRNAIPAVSEFTPSSLEQAKQRLGFMILKMTEIAGVTAAELHDVKKLKSAVEEYNVQVGGLLPILEGRTLEEVTPETRPMLDKITRAQKIEFLRSLERGERMWFFTAGGRATRLNMPKEFDQLGIAGQTQGILEMLLAKGHNNTDSFEYDDDFTELIQNASDGIVNTQRDLSFLQRELLDLESEIRELAAEVGDEAGVSAEEAMAGIHFIATGNPSNRETLQKQLASMKFPGTCYVIEQDEIGGFTYPDENGAINWTESDVFPEGHGDPFVGMVTRSHGAYQVGAGGIGIPLESPLRTVLMNRGVKFGLLAQSHDLHLLTSSLMPERWQTAFDEMAESKTSMVMEMTENKINQSGGGAFKKRDSDDVVVRDTIAMTHPKLKPFEIPRSIARMLYVFDLDALGVLTEDSLPSYLKMRGTFLGREILSADASSEVSTRLMEKKDLELNTYKNRTRIQVALDEMAKQSQKPRFEKTVERFLSNHSQNEDGARALLALDQQITASDPKAQTAMLLLAGPQGRLFGNANEEGLRRAAEHGIEIARSQQGLTRAESLASAVAYLRAVRRGGISVRQAMQQLSERRGGQRSAVTTIHIGQVKSLVDADLADLAEALEVAAADNQAHSDVTHDVVVVTHQLTEQQTQRLAAVVEGHAFVGIVSESAIPLEAHAKSYNRVLAVAAAQGRLQAAQALVDENFDDADFETFSRIPGQFRADGLLRAIWTLLLNIENNGYAIVPVEDAYENAALAHQMA